MSTRKQMLFSLAGLFILLSMLLMSSIFNAAPSLQIHSLDASWLNTDLIVRGAMTLILFGTVLGMYAFGFSFFRIALVGYLIFWALFDYIFLTDFVGPAMLLGVGIIVFLVNTFVKNRTDKMLWSLVVIVAAVLFMAKDGMQPAETCEAIMQDNLALCQPETAVVEPPVKEFVEPDIEPEISTPEAMPTTTSATFIALITAVCMFVLIFLVWLWRALFNKKTTRLEDTIQQQLKRTMAHSLQSFDFDQSEKSIVDCYQALLAVLEQNNLMKKESATAREFADTLIELGFPEGLVSNFTQLFEQARYQTKGMSREQGEDAQTLLIQLVEHVETRFDSSSSPAKPEWSNKLQGEAQ